MNEGNHAVNVSAATINQSDKVTSYLQIILVSIKSCSNRLNTYGFLDSGSTVSIIDQSTREKLQARGTDFTLNIAGIHGTKELKTEKVPLIIKGLHSRVHSLEAFVHPLISLGKTNYDCNNMKKIFGYLSVLPNRSFNFTEVGIVFSQEAYELQKALDYKIGTRKESVAVLTELGWVVSVQMKGKRGQNVFQNGRKLSILVGHRNLCIPNQRRHSGTEKATDAEVLRGHDKVISRTIRSGHALE